jgi:hypothetical protein
LNSKNSGHPALARIVFPFPNKSQEKYPIGGLEQRELIVRKVVGREIWEYAALFLTYF